MPEIDGMLVEVMTISGARGASLVDWTSGLALAVAGEGPGGDHAHGAADVAELARVVMLQPSFADPLADDPGAEDVIVSTPDRYHLIRFLTAGFDARLLLHLQLDRAAGNLALARRQLAVAAEGLAADR
ncbi:hypothetical protein E6W39_33630 [Kitasatospora acidiphila]|uniref:Roadblock/LAMTOR2 domain-containing protein n=1 Tax=Kitasatospora acidiphila TaxID=2567942 RepID=A0A540WBG7_9ACTN|nr:hypothetical protein [Kitasatospora acidiphila]TQF06257.1 hypothetical protein E6W39_33630 [Kitasatospora acidiphila]